MVKPFKVIEQFIDQQNRIADFIQNGPSDGIGGHIRNEYRKRCNQFANLPSWAQALGNGTAGTMNRICQPYWDDSGVDGPVTEQPFEGGQCAVNYQVGFQRRQFVSGTWQWSGTFNRQGLGPVGVRTFAPALNCENADGQVPTGAFLTFNGVDSGPTPMTNQCSDAAPGYRIVSVVRLDGQADNCGDPAPISRPGPNPPEDPGPTPGPEPRDDPDGGPIPEIPIPPYDDPESGPTPIEPSEEPSGEPGPPAGGDGLPGEPDSVGDPAGGTGTDGEGEDIDFGEPPAGKVWVGALIENTVDPRFGNIPGTGPANTVYPYVIGNASLRYSTGRSSSSRMRSRWHDIYRPVTALEVIGCFVQCRPGVSAVVRPVSATICPENPCEDTDDG